MCIFFQENKTSKPFEVVKMILARHSPCQHSMLLLTDGKQVILVCWNSRVHYMSMSVIFSAGFLYLPLHSQKVAKVKAPWGVAHLHVTISNLKSDEVQTRWRETVDKVHQVSHIQGKIFTCRSFYPPLSFFSFLVH